MSDYPLTPILESLLGDLYGSGINAMAHCPLHEDRTPSLSVHQGEGMWRCHSCGSRGGLDKLFAIVGEEMSDEIRWDMAIRSVKDVPPVERNFSVLANVLYNQGLRGHGDTAIRDFLNSRDISIDARHHFWLGWDGSRISFPYWGDDSRKHGTVSAIKYRDLAGHKSSEEGSRRSIYNVEDIRGAGEVIVCEGESDTMVAWTHAPNGYAVCGIPGASVSRGQWEIWALDLLFAEDILLAFDADEAGDKGAALAAEVLGDKVLRMRPADGLDISSHWLKYRSLPHVG
jgi:DNA primase